MSGVFVVLRDAQGATLARVPVAQDCIPSGFTLAAWARVLTDEWNKKAARMTGEDIAARPALWDVE